MIVAPIVAAHGLTIPKTSSRAITSPAGTADTMEVLAGVDLGIEEMKEVVSACHGCLVWGACKSIAGRRYPYFGGAPPQPCYTRANGRLNHVKKDCGWLYPFAG